jgi:hypothetical protein
MSGSLNLIDILSISGFLIILFLIVVWACSRRPMNEEIVSGGIKPPK